MYLIIVVFLDAAVIQGYVTYFCGCFVTIESALHFDIYHFSDGINQCQGQMF